MPASNDGQMKSDTEKIKLMGGLKCTLIVSYSKNDDMPHGRIAITNESNQIIRIKYNKHPLQYLNLIVRNSNGQIVSSSYYGSIFSPFSPEEIELSLEPNWKYEHSVYLLGTLKKKDRKHGQYSIQAIYKYKGREYKSNTVNVGLK